MDYRIEITPSGNDVLAAEAMPDIGLDIAREIWGKDMDKEGTTFKLHLPEDIAKRISQCLADNKPAPGLIIYADGKKAYIDIDKDINGVNGSIYFEEAPGDWDECDGNHFISFSYDIDTDEATTENWQ